MFDHLSNFQEANPALWQGRKDTVNKERFFEKVEFIDESQILLAGDQKTLLIGFCSDTGITRNLGRPGARLGPDSIKKQLAKLPSFNDPKLIDLGNIICEGDDLESAQQQFAELIHFCHQHGHKTIGLGGGHEIAWAHYQGLAATYPRLGIINFDAHFDLRPYQDGQPGTSGTPFSQIAAYCEKTKQEFHYCCVGIQQFGNTPSLFQKAHELQVNFLSAAEINQTSFAAQCNFLDDFISHVDSIYLTICLDVLAECFAPGVSAPQTMGLTPWQILPLMQYIIHSGKVVSLDVAELSPPLDKNEKTSRLAALIIAELLHTT